MVYTFCNLFRFARVCNHVTDYNARNKLTSPAGLSVSQTSKKILSKFNRRHCELISKLNVGLKTLLRGGLSEPEFYGELVYKLKKLIGGMIFIFIG